MERNETRHTPGPWAVHPAFPVIVPANHLPRPIGMAVDAAEDFANYAQQIAMFREKDRHRTREELQANARLIAAAPTLLTAAIEAMAAMDSIWQTKGADDDWIYDEMGSDLAAGYFSLRAAIALATSANLKEPQQ